MTERPRAWTVIEPGEPVRVEAEIPGHPGWMARAEFALQDQSIVIRSLCIEPEVPETPRGGITAQVVRHVPLSAIVSAPGRSRHGNALAFLGPMAVDAFERGSGPGPRGHGDAFYAAWAVLYLEECAEGDDPRRPTAALADQWHLPRKRVSEFIYKARERGLLVGGVRGRAGGTQGTRVEALLAGRDAHELIRQTLEERK